MTPPSFIRRILDVEKAFLHRPFPATASKLSAAGVLCFLESCECNFHDDTKDTGAVEDDVDSVGNINASKTADRRCDANAVVCMVLMLIDGDV